MQLQAVFAMFAMANSLSIEVRNRRVRKLLFVFISVYVTKISGLIPEEGVV